MFTGIVSAVGRVAKTTRETGNGKRETGLTLTIRAPYKGIKKGESIAVNGACLTVERTLKGGLSGHVDGVAVVQRVERCGDAWVDDLRVPDAVRRVSSPHGAITVDGVSLTIN